MNPRVGPTVPPEKFLLLANGRKEHAVISGQQARESLLSAGRCVLALDTTGETTFHDHDADIVLVFGGDGAILRAAHQLGERQAPVLGVNLGHLGFLAELTADEFPAALPKVLRGEFTVTPHVMLECKVVTASGASVEPPRLVLNEILVTAGPPFRLLDVEIAVDDEVIATFSGDGLILSTPIGSTAHSLGAGGPILMQSLPAVVFTPICPHTLTWRPLVDSADRRFTLRCPNPESSATLVIDGHHQRQLRHDDVIQVSRRRSDFLLARLPGGSYYRTLTNKLHWADRVRP